MPVRFRLTTLLILILSLSLCGARFGFSTTMAEAASPTNHPAQTQELGKLLREKRYIELESKLGVSSPSSSGDAFFTGVLANRQNRITKSIDLLEPLRRDKLAVDRRQVLLRTLADDYVKSYQYGKATQAYTELLGGSTAGMSVRERHDVESTLSIVRSLGDAPQLSAGHEAVDIPVTRNAAGLIEAPVTVSGSEQPWVFDTGASFSCITRSFASRLGLTISQQSGITQGVSGDDMTIHTAVIPELQIGQAKVHNVVVMVFEDKDLAVPELKLQINGIIGYPVLEALKKVTFTRDGRFLAGDNNESVVRDSSALFMEELTPLVSVGCSGTPCLMVLDTGGVHTVLSARYWAAHKDSLGPASINSRTLTGAGGSKKVPGYKVASLTLTLSGVPFTLHDVDVLSEAAGTDDDDFYGVLGQDVLKTVRSYTFDFGSMRFSVEQ
jgi:predicted aspartyl protease